jgi:uncharacterized protein
VSADSAPEPIGPVPGQERITVIDCLRGAALLGILVANMRGFTGPIEAYMRPHLMWTWMPDRIVQAFVDWLVSGKFITIFAGLFGVGFAIQMERTAVRHGGVLFYVRRMLVLLVIGLAHGLLVWWGDILTNYAVCGLVLLLFRKKQPRTILVWAHIFYWFILVMYLGFYASIRFGGTPMPEIPAPDFQAAIRVYSSGTIAEIFTTRFHEWLEANGFVMFLTRIVGVFLFGVYFWRQGYFRDPAAHLGFWQKAQRLGLPIGLIGNLAVVILEWMFHPHPMRPAPIVVVMFTLQSIAIPALSLGYAATVVLLWQDPKWQQRLLPFSYVGRMALTNYLLQSLICTTIFYSYGLRLYGRVGPLLGLVLAFVIYGLQIPFSAWWLSRHRYGPMEWVWRRLTYGRLATSSAP